jgi:hypothetical protein
MADFVLPELPKQDLTDHELDTLLSKSQHRARTAVAGAFDLEAGLRRASGQSIETRQVRQNFYVTSHSLVASYSAGANTIPDLRLIGTSAPAIHIVEDPSSVPLVLPRRGPTVLRMLVGAQLRRMRRAAGIARVDAGYAIRASDSKISRIELGRTGFKARDVADLLTLYGVTDDVARATLLALAEQANAPEWWWRYADVVPGWFEPYLGLELAASVMRTYDVQFVPGLLQTADYARAVIRLANPDDTREQIERRVELRIERQRILHRPEPSNLWTVIDEAALRRRIGNVGTMRAQLEHLIEIIELPHVSVQVLPFSVGGHVAAGGPITILRFIESELPDVIYLEQLISALYLEKPSDVDHYMTVMDRLCMEAAPPSVTADILWRILDET